MLFDPESTFPTAPCRSKAVRDLPVLVLQSQLLAGILKPGEPTRVQWLCCVCAEPTRTDSLAPWWNPGAAGHSSTQLFDSACCLIYNPTLSLHPSCSLPAVSSRCLERSLPPF